MKISQLSALSVLSFLLMACSNSSSTSSTSEEQTAQPVTESAPKSIGSPCELVSVADIKAVFSPQTEVDMEDKMLTYPTCKYAWKDGSFVDEKNIGGTKVKIVMPQEVMLVMVQNADANMFSQATAVYKDGVDLEEMGEKAIWSNQMHQLTFIKNGTMLHVNVSVANDNAINKEKAMAIANIASSNF